MEKALSPMKSYIIDLKKVFFRNLKSTFWILRKDKISKYVRLQVFYSSQVFLSKVVE